MNTKPAQAFVNLRLTVDQHDALARLSRERDVTVSNLIRAGVAAVTGVPDEIEGHRHYRHQRGGTT
jgi:hypothetical protein